MSQKPEGAKEEEVVTRLKCSQRGSTMTPFMEVTDDLDNSGVGGMEETED